MRSKKTLIIILSLLALGVSAYYLVKYKLDPNRFDDDNAAPAAQSLMRPVENFTGDNGVLLKGKLLDDHFKKIYDALPDTLVHLHFGDQLFCVNGEGEPQGAIAAIPAGQAAADEPHLYSFFMEKPGEAKVNETVKTSEKRFEPLLQYLKLAEQGKAAFPAFSLAGSERAGEMMGGGAFNSRYGGRFAPAYLTEIPFGIKEVMLQFFNSDEGKDYDFITTDQRDHRALIRHGSFTGKDKDELACVVGTRDNLQSVHQEKVLVFAYNSQGEAYLIYKEDFNDKLLLETVYPDPEERWDADVYQNTEEKKPLSFDGIRIKQASQPDIVLAYNKEFDKMNRYLQVPQSKFPKGDEGE